MAVTLNASTTAGLVQTADTSGVLALQTAGTTAISIDASQNVNFAGTAQRITGDFSNATAANRVTFQTSTTNGNTLVSFIPNGSATQTNLTLYNGSDVTTNFNLFTIRHNATASTLASAIGGTGAYVPIIFETGGSTSLRLSATSKAVILAGGSTSADGTGITFPATQSASTDANTLDDYEEGTWTPTVTFGGGSATVASFAAYIKIGKTCFVNGYVSFSSVSSASAGSITNFPFTAANISGSPRQVLVAREDAATGKMGQVFISAGSTTAALQDYAGANAGTVFANGYTWIFTGTYNTSA